MRNYVPYSERAMNMVNVGVRKSYLAEQMDRCFFLSGNGSTGSRKDWRDHFAEMKFIVTECTRQASFRRHHSSQIGIP